MKNFVSNYYIKIDAFTQVGNIENFQGNFYCLTNADTPSLFVGE